MFRSLLTEINQHLENRTLFRYTFPEVQTNMFKTSEVKIEKNIALSNLIFHP